MTRLPGDGWEQALTEYKAVADDLHAGRTLRPAADAMTVALLCNHFLTAKKYKLDADEITPRTFAEYKSTTDRLVATFGENRRVDDLHADDFHRLRAALATQFGPLRLGNEIQMARTMFKYGTENGLLEKTVRFGSEFKKPAKKVLRLHKAKVGKKLFTADEVRSLVAQAGLPLRAMILLGTNCAFGNSDVGTLPLSCLNLKTGYVEFPRPKTGIERKCPLWPETIAALQDALVERPAPKDAVADGLVFITKYGHPWAGEGLAIAVSHEFGKLLAKLGRATRRLILGRLVGVGMRSAPRAGADSWARR
jgi:integrase